MRSSQQSITETLKRAIRDSGKSLKSIAQETGVERMSISRFMSGAQTLRLDKADILCAYFGIEISQKQKPRKDSKV
ncbi:MAG: helix-turn-helix transcriptional regulator [Candidatus Hydrogenedentes bacterium]|nr:helix-turn-helix transcriptional regulator [Candidatus Hydrogenedentota bacterium]